MITAVKFSLVLAACAASAMLAVNVTAASKPKERIFEMRTYTANPGRTEAMHKRFRDHTCTLFKKHGMELVGFWVPQEKKDDLVYILAFPSRDAAKASWKAFQDDPEWKKVRDESHKDGVVVGKVVSVYMDPTDYSDIK
jgi:hypothetical protein